MGTIGGLIFGLVVGGAVVLLAKSVGAAPGGQARFKMGDHIIYKTRLPTDVIYVVAGVDLARGLYDLGDGYVNQYSITVFDANYVLV